MEYLNTIRLKFRKFSRLPAGMKLEVLLYSSAYLLYLPIFRLIGYVKTKNIIDRLIPEVNTSELINESRIKRKTETVRYSTADGLLKTSCLEKSLYSYFILGMNGIRCDLKIGINDNFQDFRAHAWLEFNDKKVIDNLEQGENFSAF